MGNTDGQSRSSQVGTFAKDGKSEGYSTILGEPTKTSGKHGINTLCTSGEDWGRRYILTSRKSEDCSPSGGVIERLIEELEHEAEYHRNQTSQIEDRLDQLRQLSNELKNIKEVD